MPAPSRRPPPQVCPVCGEDDIPRNARACPACGADERSGWHPGADAHDAEDAFDYDRFIREEFDGAGGRGMRPQHVAPLWWGVGIILVLLFVWGYFLAGGFK